MSDVDFVAKAAELGRDPHALVAMQCDECGTLLVCSVARAVQHAETRPDSTDQQPGHHVHPEDPEQDWICYGHPVEVDHPVAIKAFQTRSMFGVAAVQLSKDDQLALGTMSREERKMALESGDFVRSAADPDLHVNAIDAQIADLQTQRDEAVQARARLVATQEVVKP